MQQRRARPTLMTVAHHAGVSVASVSRVLNGVPASPDMVQRVRGAIDLVGYVPDAVARSLRAGRTHQLAFAVENLANPAYIAMMRSIERVTKQAGYRLLVHATGSDTADELALLRSVRHGYVDGLILCPIRVTDALVHELGRAPLPVVVIGTLPEALPVDSVRADSRRGARLAVEHLLGPAGSATPAGPPVPVGSPGSVALINGPVDTVPGSARQGGFLDALAARGIRGEDARVITADDFGPAAGYRAAGELLRGGLPEALLCANDLLAFGALRRLGEADVVVPRDLRVVGMDDTELAALSTPSLSSVSLGATERGRLAGRLLVERMEHPELPPRRLVVPPQLIVRESSGRPPSRRPSSGDTAIPEPEELAS